MQWFFETTDTVRTFSLLFLAEGAISRYEDVAVLYYQVISEELEKATENLQVEVHPPAAITGENIVFWWHGSLDVGSEITTFFSDGKEKVIAPAGNYSKKVRLPTKGCPGFQTSGGNLQ